MFRKILRAIVLVVLLLVLAIALVPIFVRTKLFDIYTGRLDAWVKNGGQIEVVQKQVVESCGMLVWTQARAFERLQLMTIYRDEFDFRVDVCTKMTVNRIHKQPEFEKPQIITLICDDTNPYHELFGRLCRKSGLRD